jgi:Fic family protein
MDNGFLFSFPPSPTKIETVSVLKKAAEAHRALAELKGISHTIPNQAILINTLSLQEAKDSSAVENIITTQDDLYKEELFGDYIRNASAKEVQSYATALKHGFHRIREKGLLTNRIILEIQEIMKQNRAGFRKLPGTELKNEQTGETVYRPPQDYETITSLMAALEKIINDDTAFDTDPLVKMACIHHQFESVHPFYDANGRTGRIINILYMVLKNLLNIPVLYLSRYIIKTKPDYYRLLQKTREKETWEEWICYMLEGVKHTSKNTIHIIEQIRNLMMDYKHRIRKSFAFYSQELLNNLFFHPYTRIEFLEKSLGITRQTASKYLDKLTTAGFLHKQRLGRVNYYVNEPLCAIFQKAGEE